MPTTKQQPKISKPRSAVHKTTKTTKTQPRTRKYRRPDTRAAQDLRRDVATEIARAMKREGVTRSELAERMNISRASATLMLGDEDGTNLTLKSLAAIGEAIGCDVTIKYRRRM